MSKVALKRFRHPRPAADFRVDSMSMLLDLAARHEKAGFPAIPAKTMRRRYWQYLNFLQRHEFTLRIVAASAEDVSESSELRNSDLTDEGFRFVQYSHDKWLDRTYKDQGEVKEETMLQRWLARFAELRSPDNGMPATCEDARA